MKRRREGLTCFKPGVPCLRGGSIRQAGRSQGRGRPPALDRIPFLPRRRRRCHPSADLRHRPPSRRRLRQRGGRSPSQAHRVTDRGRGRTAGRSGIAAVLPVVRHLHPVEPPAGAVRSESRPQPTQRHIVFYGAGFSTAQAPKWRPATRWAPTRSSTRWRQPDDRCPDCASAIRAGPPQPTGGRSGSSAHRAPSGRPERPRPDFRARRAG